MRNRVFIRLLPLLLVMAGCRQKEIVPDGKFVDLYVELKLATVAYASDVDKVNEVRRVILAQHHMTPAQFHEQYVRLAGEPAAWRKFQEEVVRKADAFPATHKVDTQGDRKNGI